MVLQNSHKSNEAVLLGLLYRSAALGKFSLRDDPTRNTLSNISLAKVWHHELLNPNCSILDKANIWFSIRVVFGTAAESPSIPVLQTQRCCKRSISQAQHTCGEKSGRHWPTNCAPQCCSPKSSRLLILQHFEGVEVIVHNLGPFAGSKPRKIFNHSPNFLVAQIRAHKVQLNVIRIFPNGLFSRFNRSLPVAESVMDTDHHHPGLGQLGIQFHRFPKGDQGCVHPPSR